MGTNYYLQPETTESVGELMQLHIGKSSAGWCFSLHVYPDHGINDLAVYERLFWSNSFRIVDEYGEVINPKDMMATIAERKSDKEWSSKSWLPFYENEEEFHRQNGSQRGPNNMIRHKIREGHCIGHGEGTWDFIVGDFS